jgi:RNA polymerase sigma factor FliA
MQTELTAETVLRENEANIAYLAEGLLSGSTLARRESFEDLMQVGRMACWMCLRRFDPNTGNQFWTFAFRRVRGAMVDHVRRCGLVPRLAYGRGHELPRLCNFERQSQHPRFKETFAVDSESELFVASAALKVLVPSERRMLARYFVDGLKWSEIASEMGVSESWVSLTLKRCLATIREGLVETEVACGS